MYYEERQLRQGPDGMYCWVDEPKEETEEILAVEEVEPEELPVEKSEFHAMTFSELYPADVAIKVKKDRPVKKVTTAKVKAKKPVKRKPLKARRPRNDGN